MVDRAIPSGFDGRAANGGASRVLDDSFPAEWVYRRVSLRGHVSVLRVPAYIVRIDIDEVGRRGTHGWQVRYLKQKIGSKFFSDSEFDAARRLGTPGQSLHAAMTYLKGIWKGVPARPLLPGDSPRKMLPTGMAGVRLVWRRRARGSEYLTVRVDRIDGRYLGSVYVGTRGTVSDTRVARCLAKAKRLRREHLAMEGRSVARR